MQIFNCRTRFCDDKEISIPADQFCDGIKQCSDGSDEKEEICTGINNNLAYTIFGVIFSYILIGILFYCCKKNFETLFWNFL